jgi:acetoin utilization deacetylase AcuC-like enzyme
MAGIRSLHLGDDLISLPRREATVDELARVHTHAYLTELAESCRASAALDPDTYASPASLHEAAAASGAGLAVIDALRSGTGDLGFVAARPPGHHANTYRAMGFCLINHIAVAAASLADAGERVAIIDWDVHHGNGTQDIFWNDGRVLYISTHQAPFYPGTGRVLDTGGPHAIGSTVNIPLPAGATGDVVRMALAEVAAPVLERFDPTWVLVSAGFDAHRDDPLADLALTDGDFALLAGEVSQFAPAPGRLIFFLEGGYNLDAIEASVAATIGALVGQPTMAAMPTSGGPGAEAVALAARIHTEPREHSLW